MDERAKARRADWAPDLGLVAAGGAQLDVQSGDSQQLALLSHVLEGIKQGYQGGFQGINQGSHLGGQHSGVGRSLITIGLHLHASGDTGDGLTAGQIRNVDEGVVEAGVDVGHSEDDLAVANLGSQLDLDLLLLNFSLPGCHSARSARRSATKKGTKNTIINCRLKSLTKTTTKNSETQCN